jgi:hypothetical protein
MTMHGSYLLRPVCIRRIERTVTSPDCDNLCYSWGRFYLTNTYRDVTYVEVEWNVSSGKGFPRAKSDQLFFINEPVRATCIPRWSPHRIHVSGRCPQNAI